MVSTLALRWQTMCPPGGSLGGDTSPKEDEAMHEESKEQKLPFCTIQWQYEQTDHV